ncbi:MFS transporter [Komagataeibacter sp. FNDCF1]|uniref:MFS transporter n=1 Tax=Komagataeibacter sp. FNDCF1 TaxID=2878681 RepID=UPI001E4800BB|nr:MFS transporter [Komagataeibacter sp. FNDCF1]MCE2563642.1 MFS transporter [Komagataeibacter sp. FNDCF1]
MFSTLSRSAKIGLCVLCATTFTAITSELAPVGLLLEMGQSFHINSGQVGMAVSAYALIVALMAVPLTILTARIERKRLLLAALAGYAVSNMVGALAPTFWLLCVGRAIGGAAHALLMSIISAYAAQLVPRRVTGRAISFVFCGASFGAVAGVPAAAAIGQFLGWRVALLTAGGLAAILAAVVVVALPSVATPARGSGFTLRGNSRAVRNFGLIMGVTAGFFFAHNLVYTYIAPVLLAHGLPESSISVDLLAIGVCSLAGLWGAGHLVDTNPRAGMLGAGALLLVGLGLLVGHAVSGVGAIAAGAIWCAGYAGAIPFFMSGAIRTQATTADIAGAAVNSTSNVGILLGSAVGGGLLATQGQGVLAPVAIGIGAFCLLLVMASRSAFPRHVVHEDDEPALSTATPLSAPIGG